MLEKWKEVVCTDVREQPSSRGLLPCTTLAITRLHLILVAREEYFTLHDVYPFIISFCYLIFVMGENSADESSFDMGPNKQKGEKEVLDQY